MHAYTALALGCGLLSYIGGMMFCGGLCGLVFNDAVERAAYRITKL